MFWCWICYLETQLFPSQDVNWWTGVVWVTCGLFHWFYQSFGLDSDGTHSLQRIHCDGMLHFYKSVKMKKQTHKTNTFWANVHFWVKYSFKIMFTILIPATQCMTTDKELWNIKITVFSNCRYYKQWMRQHHQFYICKTEPGLTSG